jgi:hypothetical protein
MSQVSGLSGMLGVVAALIKGKSLIKFRLGEEHMATCYDRLR